MRWDDVRRVHPNQWLVIEAVEAHTAGQRRVFDRIAVVESCTDGATTMKRYRELHRAHPQRELCFVHTANAELDIVEESWVGVRVNHAIDASAR